MSLKKKAPGVDKIPSESMGVGGGKLYGGIHKLVLIWNKKEFPREWKKNLLLFPFIRKAINGLK